MADLFERTENPYEAIYASLREVREAFHREGRLGDSNAKLDETIKFFAVHYAYSKGRIKASNYNPLLSPETFSVPKLNSLFVEVASQPPFSNAQLGSIFGARPSIAFEPGDENVAYELFRASGHALTAHKNAGGALDILNETFGHYVRDNFRNHIEDAQYMTPPEVVDFMVGIAAHEIFKTKQVCDTEPFTMMDPSCGVGSFLVAWRKEFERRQEGKKNSKLLAVGQDKVERMARLSSVNLIFSGDTTDRVLIGNSLIDASPLTKFNGKVDLILTNPPFGAKFDATEIKRNGVESTPIFATSTISPKMIDSELLFIDRYLSLLRPGGLCLVIVPDGVISARGTPAYLRQQLARRALLRGVIELPPVTFSQAGTRTKTAILVFEKPQASPPKKTSVFFAEADDLGFEVAKRKGVPVKRSEGHNQLPDILRAFQEKNNQERDSVDRPLISVWRDIEPTEHDAWTPRRFAVDERNDTGLSRKRDVVQTPLGELVESPVRRTERYSKGKLYISVLHVIGEGIFDVAGINAYEPITPGTPVLPGEVIISRINPRIPRVLVVPDLGSPLLCSSEFEVLRPKKGVSPYAIAYFLMSDAVQKQIHALTAGTSASHSRVKSEKLLQIQIPWPIRGARTQFDRLIKEYQNSMQALSKALCAIHNLRTNQKK